MESLGKSQGQNQRGLRPRWFCLRDFPKDSIHHDLITQIFILLSSQTRVWEFCSGNGLPREYHGQYNPSDLTNIDSDKSNILGREVDRIKRI